MKQRLAGRVRASQTLVPLVLAAFIGVGAGLAAVAFRYLIRGAEWLFFTFAGGELQPFVGKGYTILTVAAGGLLVGLITKYFAPETKGHGVPEVMLAVTYQGGRIRPRVAVFKALAAALCIGSGGAAGREGPIVQIGSAFGSFIGQVLRLPDRRITLSVACGAAGGIAATFNAPMAGVIFALEVILARFTAATFGLIVLSSVTATIVSRSLIGDYPAFRIATEHLLVTPQEVILYVVLGVACAAVAQMYIRTLYAVEDISNKIAVPDWVKPGIGGALVGLVGIWRPEIFGTGYNVIEQVLENDPARVAVAGLLLLAFSKVLCTSLTIGSGGSGGIFAPALFIGAMFGGGFGAFVHGCWPDATGMPGSYGLVGMAAVFAGAAHAPITAILIVFEMTDDYHIILPLMTATVLSAMISDWISHDSIYTIKLRRRGIPIARTQDVNLMDGISVQDAMTTDFTSVPPELALTDLAMQFAADRQFEYPVVNSEGRLTGVVTIKDVEEALIGRDPGKLAAGDVCTKNVVVCRPDQSLSTALALMGANGIGRLPVIDPQQPDRMIGLLLRSGIIEAYARAYGRSADVTRRLDEMRAVSERGDVVVCRKTIKTSARLAGLHVRDAGFPLGSTLVSVRRGEQTLVPRGSTQLQVGDFIVVAATREHARNLARWLSANC